MAYGIGGVAKALPSLLLLPQAAPVWEPATLCSQAGPVKPVGSRDLVPKFAIGSFQVVLEQTQLAAVAARFDSVVGRSGDASESLAWVCLQGHDEQGPWSLWVESDEIHGPAVGGLLLLRRAPTDRLDSRCRSIEAVAIDLPLPVRLGMPRAQALAALGPPASESETCVVYHHHTVMTAVRKKGSPPVRVDVFSSLYLRFSGDAIDGMQVWRTTDS